jgi:EmrB/QacA subfamily drug resistance transporter
MIDMINILNTKSPWIIFTLVAVAQFMVVLDYSITNVSLPAITQSLHFSTNNLQWVITSYALMFGGFLLFGGRAADLFGRRKMLLFGMISFTIISLFIGFSQSALMLIILRALQGLSAAFMSPAALSIVLKTFKEGRQRNKALGYWSTVSAGGAAVGLLLGGVLTQYIGWRWNFFINVPIGLIISYAILKFVPPHESEAKHADLDFPGAILITSALMIFVFLISQIPLWGIFSLPAIGLFVLVSILILLFLVNESHSSHPLIPLSIFAIRNVVAGNIMIIPLYASMMGQFFLLSLYIQTILHFSPVLTGLSYLPFPIILGFVSSRISGIVSKHGYKRFLILGPLLVAIGTALLSNLPVHGNYFINILPTMVLIPLGLGITFMPILAAATSGVRPDQAGLASGLINTSQQMGGALGLSILIGVATSITASSQQYGAREALVHGYDKAFLVAMIFNLFVAFVAFTLIKEKKHPKQQKEISSVQQQVSVE